MNKEGGSDAGELLHLQIDAVGGGRMRFVSNVREIRAAREDLGYGGRLTRTTVMVGFWT